MREQFSALRRPLHWIKWLLIVPLTGAAACGLFSDSFLGGLLKDSQPEKDRFGIDPGPPVYTARSFVNWESPHVSPLALSPGGTRLFAVNTAAARLEVFDVTDAGPVHAKSIPVGLDPVSVRARSEDEAWVVNHISDSVSVVDVPAGLVKRTLSTDDEPHDLIFAAGRAFVTCGQRDLVQVFDLNDPSAPPLVIPIAGERPRAAALSPDGGRLYVAIFESGNGTTILNHQAVSDPFGPYGGQNPPPNRPDGIWPPPAPDSPPAPPNGLIVRQDPASGRWLDEQGADWSAFVTWGLHDHDVAVIDTQTLAVSYIRRLMNLNMALAVRPDGALTVVGTEAFNHVRFEPNLTAKFVRGRLAVVSPAAPDSPSILEINPHLLAVYDSPITTLPPEQRAASIADPRAIAWSGDGSRGYVAGLGSNNVAVIDAAGTRLATFDVGQGPTGLALDEARGRLYVLNRFDATITVVDTASLTALSAAAFEDPTPEAIRAGRPFLYDARRTSGLGVTACAACHVDARMDQLSWDLGSPGDPPKPFNQSCDDLGELPFMARAVCEDFHPLKGPLLTQTLQGIIGVEPFHWRGDREDLAAFNPAFVGLNGNDRQLTQEEMAAMQAFLAEVAFPPNPHRNRDNSLKEDLAGANPRRGQEIYLREEIDTANGRVHASAPLVQLVFMGLGPVLSCNRCHQLPLGTNRRITTATDLTMTQSIKVPQLRNIYQRTAFDRNSMENGRGFGFTHDGSFASLAEFFGITVFDFGAGEEGARRLADVLAFLQSFSTDTHAGVGMQVTLGPDGAADPATAAAVAEMIHIADSGDVGLVVHGGPDGQARGFAYRGSGVFQADGAGETWTADQLRELAAAGAHLTWTIVPLGSENRLGLDAP
ncbi:MAG: YncE family protein [Phycisphaerae bacterium]